MFLGNSSEMPACFPQPMILSLIPKMVIISFSFISFGLNFMQSLTSAIIYVPKSLSFSRYQYYLIWNFQFNSFCKKKMYLITSYRNCYLSCSEGLPVAIETGSPINWKGSFWMLVVWNFNLSSYIFRVRECKLPFWKFALTR